MCDIRYLVDLDYDTYTSCESSGCNAEGICRCSTIENLTISGFKRNLSIRDLCELIYNHGALEYDPGDIPVGKDIDINLYCFHRFLLYSKWDFNSEISGGYYGQEIDGIYLTDQSKDKMRKAVEFLLEEQDVTKKVLHALTIEYGFPLSKLENKTASIQTVWFDDIIAPNKERAKKVKDSRLYSYWKTPPSIPMGVCTVSGDKYNLVDGYNRLAAIIRDLQPHKKKDKMTISMIVFE